MEKISRVKKYAHLREELMNDGESQVSSNDLSEFAERLNRIDATQFDKMETFQEEGHDPVHLRRESYFDQKEIVAVKDKTEETITSSFNNEYLDEYINEVKQYNKDRGFLASENTSVNILKEIKKEPEFHYINSLHEIQAEPSFEETTEIPFIGSTFADASSISMEVKNLISGEEADGTQLFDTHKVQETVVSKPISSGGLQFIDSYDEPMQFSSMAKAQDLSALQELDKERQLRERLMNETVKMRAQLDEHDKELDDVNDSVMHANKVLNIVLIILILAMLVIGGILAYWVLLDKGVI